MRKFLLTIHAYLGLFCIPYLLIFSVSSLDFNHHFLEKNTRTFEDEWNEYVNISSNLEGAELGSALRDSLHLFGWYVPWDSYSDSSRHHIKITHFGKEFEIDKPRNSDSVRVKEYRLPAGKILFGLHALGNNIPGAPALINSWQYYQDLTVYSSLFWVITGLYLWLVRKRKSPVSPGVLLFASVFSLTLMLYLWLAG